MQKMLLEENAFVHLVEVKFPSSSSFAYHLLLNAYKTTIPHEEKEMGQVVEEGLANSGAFRLTQAVGGRFL